MSNPIRFRHVTTTSKKKEDGTIVTRPARNKYTVAYSFEKVGDQLEVVYGVAQCRSGSRGDTFSRKAGRDMAEARLKKALKKGDAANGDSIHYGKLTITDGEGVNVGQRVSEQFEYERKDFLTQVQGLRDTMSALGLIAQR